LIEAVLELKREIGDIQLHLVGGGGRKEKKILSLVSAHKDCLEYHGKIYDKEKLCAIYRRCSIFAMPSIHETFGLVYLEALTQNLAVLYTRHQGIDGLFDDKIGERVNPFSKDSIKDALRKMLTNRNSYTASGLGDFSSFRWDKIALNYKKMYEETV
jgi:glycosyltransferase involved in cell wall biosynthesis